MIENKERAACSARRRRPRSYMRASRPSPRRSARGPGSYTHKSYILLSQFAPRVTGQMCVCALSVYVCVCVRACVAFRVAE